MTLPKHLVVRAQIAADLGRLQDGPALDRAQVDELYDLVDALAAKLGDPPAEPVPDPRHRSLVRWAHDMTRRGETKAAEKTLSDVIRQWIDEEKSLHRT